MDPSSRRVDFTLTFAYAPRQSLWTPTCIEEAPIFRIFVALFTAAGILLASGLAIAAEGCGHAAKSGETITKADPPKPLTASSN
jgi:hypothetical protein